MAHKIKTQGIIGAFFCLVWLAACASPSPTSTPTPDLNPLRTEVAATVLAQVTRNLALTPSATLLPSLTPTYLPTSTPLQTASATPSLPAVQISGTPKLASATPALSTGTPTAVTTNLAQWVSQSVADDTLFDPSQTFTMTWTLKNVGTSTWKTTYMLRFYSGDNFSAPKEIPLGKEVPPGGTIDITIKMKAPIKPGSYLSDWVMSTEFRGNFKEPVYLRITVRGPTTPTPTP
jgi:hypothetical protein